MFGSAASGGVRAGRATVGAVLLVAAALAAGVAAVALAVPAWAADLTVETASDEQNANEVCSLREAIMNANGDDQSGSSDCVPGGGVDRIDFDLGEAPVTITLTSQLPAITDDAGLTVDGEDAHIAISGNDAARVFEVESGAKLALTALTLEKGLAHLGEGGGILNRGDLTVSGSTLRANSAPGGSGGGIANLGTATVSGSTLSANSASGGGEGGGISNEGDLTVSGSTLSDNGAALGGSIHNGAGETELKNTIVANSTSGGDCLLGGGTITDGGYNLSSDDTCGFSTDNRSRLGADPDLDPLADNGGPTPTHALPKDSPAVDQGYSFGATADQRGLPRPTDLGDINNATGGDGSDIGAYEQVRCSGDVVNAAGTIVGTPGNDNLEGDDGDDLIFGLGGRDRIRGMGGNDEVCSGKGNDTLFGGEGNDRLLAGEGKDYLHGGPGNDELYGLRGVDMLDTRDGVRKNDLADGGTGQDVCKTNRGDVKRRCQ